MKKLIAALVAALSLATAAQAVTITPFSPGNGSVSDLTPPTGFAYTIVGNGNGQQNLETGFSIAADAGETVTINASFSYFTADRDGSLWDSLFVTINGSESNLITPAVGFLSFVNGTVPSFTLLAGQSASFFIRSLDGDLGAATATLAGTIDIALVPLPASLLLLLAAVGGLGVASRRRASAA
jgi:hypothetical protein